MKTGRRLIMAMVMLILTITVNSGYAQENPIILKIPSHITPAYKDVFPNMQQFTDRINELGKGKVKAELYHSEKLFKVREMVPALMKGACDIIFHTSTHTTETWPEIGGLSLPFLYKDETDCQNHWMSGKPLFELVNEEMNRKYGVRILASGIFKSMAIMTRKVAPLTPEAFKGLKIRTSGNSDEEFIKACGGVPIFLPSSQMNQALNLGMLDGISTYPATLLARDLDDFLDYFIETDPIFCAWGYQIYVLTKTLNQWPEDVQAVVKQAAQEYDEAFLKNSVRYYHEIVHPRLEKKMKFIKPTPEQMEKFIEIARGTYGEWTKKVDKTFAKRFLELSQREE